MSEYQYYDFRAIDRPLTSSQRANLGKISTRAEISSTSFTNFYTFGDFKGNPVASGRWPGPSASIRTGLG